MSRFLLIGFSRLLKNPEALLLLFLATRFSNLIYLRNLPAVRWICYECYLLLPFSVSSVLSASFHDSNLTQTPRICHSEPCAGLDPVLIQNPGSLLLPFLEACCQRLAANSG